MPAKRPNYIMVEGDEARIELRRKNGPSIWAVIDAADVDLVSPYTWNWNSISDGVQTIWGPRANRCNIQLHRLIMHAPDGLEVDHIDHDRMNNRRSNLRIVQHYINQRNKPTKRGGVYWWKPRDCYRVLFKIKGKQRFFGCFPDYESAQKRAQELLPRYIMGDDLGF